MVFLIGSVMMILPILTISAPILSAHVSFATADDDNKRSSPYTLPLPPSLQHEPSYAIRIPFGAANKQAFSPYEPGEITIPSGMTVAWFNDDLEGHTATTISNSLSSSDMLSPFNSSSSSSSSHSSPIQFDSGVIPPGGFSVFTFTKPGIYDYYCKLHPFQHGRINVGDQIQTGTNIDMRIGGKIPFDSTKLARMTLSFVPKNITLPPSDSITYNVTIFNLTAPVYKHQFVDTDGILDLEIIPIKRTITIPASFSTDHIGNNTMTTILKSRGIELSSNSNSSIQSSQRNLTTTTSTTTNGRSTNSLPLPSIQLSSSTIGTTTYGPDINAPITGTFHIEGPLLIEPYSYRIRVQIVAIDYLIPSKAIVEEFALYEKVGFLMGL
jgi:plastocyanin